MFLLEIANIFYVGNSYFIFICKAVIFTVKCLTKTLLHKKGLTQNPKVFRQILLNSFPNAMNEKGQIAITSPAGVSEESLRSFRGKRLHLFCVD